MKKWESKSIEIAPKETQMLDLLDKDLNVFTF